MLKMLCSFRRFQHKRVGIFRLYVRSSFVLSKGRTYHHSWLLLSRFYAHTVREEKRCCQSAVVLAALPAAAAAAAAQLSRCNLFRRNLIEAINNAPVLKQFLRRVQCRETQSAVVGRLLPGCITLYEQLRR